jgi:hypothetical protein
MSNLPDHALSQVKPPRQISRGAARSLTWIKFAIERSAIIRSHSWERIMPIEIVIVVACITAAFIGFGVVLAWAERKTSHLHHE